MRSPHRWSDSLFNVAYTFGAVALSQALGSPFTTSYLLICAAIALVLSLVLFLVADRKDPSA